MQKKQAHEKIGIEEWNSLMGAVTDLATSKNITLKYTLPSQVNCIKDGRKWVKPKDNVESSQIKNVLGAINQLEASFSGNCCQANCCQKTTCQSCQSQCSNCTQCRNCHSHGSGCHPRGNGCDYWGARRSAIEDRHRNDCNCSASRSAERMAAVLRELSKEYYAAHHR